ncbi:MAG: hypothetical protein OXK82_12880 [Deltaproteobacteria bacterium]|nr:hypothetical protein [Deltaproteobacteria bacterium]
MSPDKFGDSYDIVKRDIIHWLACPEEWAVHPMYFGGNRDFVNRYTDFLGITCAEGDIRSRRRVVSVGRTCPKHLFLDPNTGLKPEHQGPTDSQWDHVTMEELAQIADGPNRASKLTLVYDQGYQRPTNEERKPLAEAKLQTLRCDHDMHSVAYVAHVVFIWVSKDEACSPRPHGSSWNVLGYLATALSTTAAEGTT